MRRLGLRTQILLTLTAAVVVGLALVYGFGAQMQMSTLRQERARQGRALASLLVAVIERSWTGSHDALALSERLDTLAESAGAAGVVLLDSAGDPALRAQLPRLRGLAAESDVRALAGDQVTARYVGDGDGERLLVRAPLAVRGLGAPRGLLLALQTEHIRERLALSNRLVFLFAGVVLLFIVVIGHLVLTRLVVLPVRRVIRSMDRFEPPESEPRAGGELGPLRHDEGGNEIERLSSAFVELTARLKDYAVQKKVQLLEAQALNKRLQETQESLVRSEKLASVGLLTAGIAHEIGNPVSIVLGYTELLQRDDTTAEERQSYVEQIDEAAQRVNRIIRDLLDFSRPAQRASEVADVPEVVSRCLKLLAPQKRFRGVRVETAFEVEPLVARIDDGRLQQVLINLLMNAADAMAGKGAVAVRAWRDADKVLIEVTDEGPGIAPENLGRIFDPFFTTKGPKAGTGLGLSICHTIVAAFGGDIRVRSKQGEGTTFTLELEAGEVEGSGAIASNAP